MTASFSGPSAEREKLLTGGLKPLCRDLRTILYRSHRARRSFLGMFLFPSRSATPHGDHATRVALGRDLAC